jgi:hypothetical protein
MIRQAAGVLEDKPTYIPGKAFIEFAPRGEGRGEHGTRRRESQPPLAPGEKQR